MFDPFCFCRMFVESCKRLRLLKSSEAIGLGNLLVIYLISCFLLRILLIFLFCFVDMQLLEQLQRTQVQAEELIFGVTIGRLFWFHFSTHSACFCGGVLIENTDS